MFIHNTARNGYSIVTFIQQKNEIEISFIVGEKWRGGGVILV